MTRTAWLRVSVSASLLRIWTPLDGFRFSFVLCNHQTKATLNKKTPSLISPGSSDVHRTQKHHLAAHFCGTQNGTVANRHTL